MYIEHYIDGNNVIAKATAKVTGKDVVSEVIIGNVEWYTPNVHGRMTSVDPAGADKLMLAVASMGYQILDVQSTHRPFYVTFYNTVRIRKANFELKAGAHPALFDVMLNDKEFAHCRTRASGKLIMTAPDELRPLIMQAITDQWIPDEWTCTSFNLYEALGVIFHGEAERMMKRKGCELFNLRFRNTECLGEYYSADYGLVRVYKPNFPTDHLPKPGYVNVLQGETSSHMLFDHGLLFELDPSFTTSNGSMINQLTTIKDLFKRACEEHNITYIGDCVYSNGTHVATWQPREESGDDTLKFTTAGLSLPFFRLFHLEFETHFKNFYAIKI